MHFVYHQGSVLGKAGLHFITVCCPLGCYLPSHLKESLTTEKLGFVNGLILCLTKITEDIGDSWTSLWDPDHLPHEKVLFQIYLSIVFNAKAVLFFFSSFMVLKWLSIMSKAKIILIYTGNHKARKNRAKKDKVNISGFNELLHILNNEVSSPRGIQDVLVAFPFNSKRQTLNVLSLLGSKVCY